MNEVRLGCLAPSFLLMIGALSLMVWSLSVVACSMDTDMMEKTVIVSGSDLALETPGTAVDLDLLRIAFATTDIAIGPNRVVFGIMDNDSEPVRSLQAVATFVYLDGTGPEKLQISTIAKFMKWPTSNAGVYVTNVVLNRDGRWGLVVSVKDQNGLTMQGDYGFMVRERTSAPAIGTRVPASSNKTVHDVNDLQEITSSPIPDPDLYQLTVAEALETGKPTIVTFATPMFCQTATCGPQVEVVSSVKDQYGMDANFIHIESFELIFDGKSVDRGPISQILVDWGLPTEPFTFVLDVDGFVTSRFEGFVTKSELEESVLSEINR